MRLAPSPQLDAGLSPAMRKVIESAAGYAQSFPAEALGGAQGSAGRFMSPSSINPWNRVVGYFRSPDEESR